MKHSDSYVPGGVMLSGLEIDNVVIGGPAIFDRETGSAPVCGSDRLRSGSVQTDLSLIV